MGTLTVRDLEDPPESRLRLRAAARNRSMEEEARQILSAAHQAPEARNGTSMSTLLDTNVLSELLRSSPASAVLAWFARQSPESLFVSVVTQAEMMLGARLATRNTDDFRNCKVALIDPWIGLAS